MSLALEVAVESFPIAGSFTISRGSRTEAVVVAVALTDGRVTGRGECVPYARYGETVDGVVAAIRSVAPHLAEPGFDRARLAEVLPAGAARNALDCALWDLEAKRGGTSVAETLGLTGTTPLVTAYTLSLGTPRACATRRSRPLTAPSSRSSSAATATSSASPRCAPAHRPPA